jgi:hypothetical protein
VLFGVSTRRAPEPLQALEGASREVLENGKRHLSMLLLAVSTSLMTACHDYFFLRRRRTLPAL